MAVALIARAVEKCRRSKRIVVEPTFSGNYAANGQVIDLAAITNPSGFPGVGLGSVPSEIRVFNTPIDYTVLVVRGVALNDWKLMFIVASTGLELAAGAYPAGITGLDDSMRLEIISKF